VAGSSGDGNAVAGEPGNWQTDGGTNGSHAGAPSTGSHGGAAGMGDMTEGGKGGNGSTTASGGRRASHAGQPSVSGAAGDDSLGYAGRDTGSGMVSGGNESENGSPNGTSSATGDTDKPKAEAGGASLSGGGLLCQTTTVRTCSSSWMWLMGVAILVVRRRMRSQQRGMSRSGCHGAFI
jgi:hypothetical protein